uniref:heavy metal translocating P-type ATPase n=1 Tax=Ellagibacter isourolithinifaciens TaxID=2137581 RepID=UPI003A8E8FB8
LHVRVTRPFEDSAVSRVLDMVSNAASKKARTEAFVRRFARIYTPIVVGAAVALAVIPPLVIGPANAAIWADFIERACVFLVISCPCALVISVPLSFYCGIGSLSRRGVLAKGGNYLEQLARVKTVVFDKTGTLTKGKFRVETIAPVEGVTPERLLGLAAHVEQRSTHPIAQSICDAYAERLGIPPTLNLPEHSDEVIETPGHGLCAECVEGHICVGNDKLMEREGVVWTGKGQPGTIIHVALDGVYQGYLVVSDETKPQARETIEGLKALGVHETVMLTGDKELVAQRIASRLGIDRFFAQLLPGDKVACVEELLAQKGGDSKATLAFVGDGINDAPALARADVGIAMGAMGSDAAIEAADIVLMDDNPAHIADAVRLSRKTVINARENVVLAIAVKFAVFVLGALGIANMWMAVFADTGVAMLCVLNAMRLLRAK